MKSRFLSAVLVASGALVATAAPAHAVILATKTDQKGISAVVNTCPLSAATGTACHEFSIEATWVKTEAGIVANNVDVVGSDATKKGDGSITGPDVAHGNVGTQTITVDPKGKSATLSFTVTLICDSPGCDLAGVFKFKISLKKGSSSEQSYTSIANENNTALCQGSTSTKVGTMEQPVAKGTVKRSGVTKTVRSYSDDDLSLVRIQTSTKAAGACL